MLHCYESNLKTGTKQFLLENRCVYSYSIITVQWRRQDSRKGGAEKE